DVAFVPYTLAAWQALGHDLQSVAAPPAFAAPATGDWSLVPGSPGRDQGVPATSLVDYQGAPRPAGAGRDVGAYER
ncbi:MAG TPA: choice-of-anchor Q domain-containing protein, partial [Planctomycetota bacterium]|nr:choice-of-anchor Q domain-containing protein [Planctomycetota bacterium]